VAVYCPPTFRRNAVSAADAPPPVHADLRDDELRRLVQAHVEIDVPSASRRISRAIANADLADIEAGRLLILHVCREIASRLTNQVEGIRAEASRDPFIAVRQAVDLVRTDFEHLVGLYRDGAGDARAHDLAELLTGVAEVAAEAKVATAILAEAFQSDTVAVSCADAAAHNLVRIRERLVALGVSPEMPGDRIDDAARIRLARQATRDLDAIAPSEIRRIERLAGNWYLLNASTPRAGSRKVGGGLVPPLAARDALNLRRAAAAAAAAFAHLRDEPGFLGLLRQVAMVERHREAAASGTTVFKGSPLANLNQRIRDALRTEAKPVPVLTLRREAGGVSGRFDDGRTGIAILDDHSARLSPRYPDAVRIVPLAAHRVDLPTIEEAAAAGIGLSFRTLEDALACIEIGDPDTVRLFFDGDYAVVDRTDEPVPVAPGATGPSPA